jgi:hypothetical protein
MIFSIIRNDAVSCSYTCLCYQLVSLFINKGQFHVYLLAHEETRLQGRS